MLAKKHFEAIAAILKAEKDTFQGNEAAELAVERVAHNLCDMFTEFNGRFDPVRFLTACGVDEPSALPVVHEVKESTEVMTMAEFEEAVKDLFPNGVIDQASDGQLTVYTGLKIDPDSEEKHQYKPYDVATKFIRVIKSES